jgi:hypothetical protein
MLHDRRFGLASILAAILATSSLVTFAETREQQLHASSARLTNAKGTIQTEPPSQLDSFLTVTPTPELAKAAEPNDSTEAPDTKATTVTPATGTALTAATFLKALELPSLTNLTPLDKAYLDAFSILRENNDCSRFYGGPRAIEALNLLKLQLKKSYFDHSIGMRMQGKTSYIINNFSGLTYRLFEKAELNTNGPFYKTNLAPLDQRIPRIGEFWANTREARVTILLHELGHMVLTSDHHFVLPDDGNDPLTSDRNSRRVIEVCRREIKAQSQIGFERALADLETTPDAKATQLAVVAESTRSPWTNITRSAP